jgi:F0F1-type ATP synthase membrane subunit a
MDHRDILQEQSVRRKSLLQMVKWLANLSGTFIIATSVVYVAMWFRTFKTNDENEKPTFLLASLSHIVRMGLDNDMPNFKRNRPYANAYIIFMVCYMIFTTCNSLLAIYTTNLVTRYSKYNINTIAALSLLCSISWIVSSIVTTRSEGTYMHDIPSLIFFVSATLQRFLFVPRKNNVTSRFIKLRTYMTYATLSLILVGFVGFDLVFGKEPRDANFVHSKKGKIKMSIQTIGEIGHQLLYHWDRSDLYKSLINYFSKEGNDNLVLA